MVERLWAFLEGIEYYALLTVGLAWANMFIGMALAYRFDPAQAPRSWRGFLRYAFPREVMLHRSTRLDCIFVVVQKLSVPILIAPAIAATVATGHFAMDCLEAWFGPPQAQSGSELYASLAFSIVGLTLAADFADFWTHRLMHRVWWLWEFHKVHHSAEVMALGLTGRRNHPIEDIIRQGSSVIAGGIVFAGFAYAFDADVDEVTFAGINVFFAVKLLTFYHLKHGHTHLSFGPMIERVLVSPAQHQLHHSVDPRHYDSNFGTLVAFWDLLYGTWRPAEKSGGYALGLQDGEHREFNSVARLYYLPFVKIWRELTRRRRAQPEAVAAG